MRNGRCSYSEYGFVFPLRYGFARRFVFSYDLLSFIFYSPVAIFYRLRRPATTFLGVRVAYHSRTLVVLHGNNKLDLIYPSLLRTFGSLSVLSVCIDLSILFFLRADSTKD
jgi:hypothetical protein